MKRSVPPLLAGFFLLVITVAVHAVDVAPILQSKEGMVTAVHPSAAQAGAEILEKGGNAVDAAIAVSLVLGVVEHYASGLCGEGYMVVVMADGREVAIDFRSTAPAIHLAEKGFEVSDTFSKVNMDAWENLSVNAPEFLDDGMLRAAGATFLNPALWHSERVGDPGPYENGASYIDVMLDERRKVIIEGETQDVPPSTTHFSVVAKVGNAFSWTQTISSFFGTGHMMDGHFLNNELGNFRYEPVEGSSINLEPGCRPRTMIALLVVRKDIKVRWVIGSPGAGRIGSTVIEILVNLIDFEMSLENAIRAYKFTGYDAYKQI